MNFTNPETRPFVIGLTGPIGSGKSLVRKMLEHLGALSIDADEQAHQAYQPGSPGFDAIVRRFGSQVLAESGHIDRGSLGKIVFSNEQALRDIEAITHPLVKRSVEHILELTPLPIVAIEAIKLFESGLDQTCDVVWIMDAPRRTLIERLQAARGMSAEAVSQRLDEQTDFSTLQNEGGAIIQNTGSVVNLWNEVRAHWETLAFTSRLFSQALEWTKSTCQSFYMPLIPLSPEAAQDLDGQFPGISGLERTFKFLCSHFVWESMPLASGRKFVVSMMKNRRFCLSSISSEMDEEHLIMIVKMIEDFATLHLCTHVEVAPYEEYQTLLSEIGYDRYLIGNHKELMDNFPCSDGYIKKILPEINYFKDRRV